MRTFQLKINFNNLSRDIEKDYFKHKDIFYRCLIVNLCTYNLLHSPILHNTIIEDSHYNQYLLHLVNRGGVVEDMIREIDTLHHMSLFLDTNVYLEEFIQLKHNPKTLNLYHLTIDDGYNAVITNKHLKRYALPFRDHQSGAL